MGTRSLIAIVSGTTVKFARTYGHDGYLAGVGLELTKSLRGIDLSVLEANLEKAVEIDNDFHLDHIDSADLIARIVDGEPIKWYPPAFNFAADSVFCEWAYIVDLKTQKLEIYKGFNKLKLADGERFKFMESMIDGRPLSDGTIYQPVRHFKTYDLSALPTEDEIKNLDTKNP